MSNPENQFETLSGAELLTAWGDYLQGKVDKRGGAVSAAGSNTRLSASWMNLVDDLMLTVANGGIQTTQTVDNTASPTVIPALTVGSTHSFTVDVPTTYKTVELTWWSLTRTGESNATDGLEFSMFSRTGLSPSELMLHAELPEGNVAGALDFSPTDGNRVLRYAYARELEEIVTDTRRVYCWIKNTGSLSSPEMQFAYAAKTYDLALTEIPVQGIPI